MHRQIAINTLKGESAITYAARYNRRKEHNCSPLSTWISV